MKIDDESGWRGLEEKPQTKTALGPFVESKLSAMREQIDSIDVQISLLLGRRFSLVQELSKIKHDLNIPVEDSQREAEVLERVSTVVDDLSVSSAVVSVYKEILRLSRELQMNSLNAI